MPPLDHSLLVRSLRLTGEVLDREGRSSPIPIVIGGGSAGLLAGIFRPSRVTGDCDLIWDGDEETWMVLAVASREAADRLGLPATWLNRDCSMYAWCFLIGWQSRCEPVGCFGPLNVLRLARIDLIATKVVGAPKRPQDLADLQDIAPTLQELALIEEHLDRLESEHLDGATFDDQREVLRLLRGGH